jgi:hypothetical protein
VSDPKKFTPKPLSAESVEAPRERRWDVMGEAEAKRLHAQRLAEHRRFAPWGPRTRKRLLRHGVTSVLVFVFVGWGLLLAFPHPLVPLVGLVVGVVVTFVRLPDMTYAPLYGAAGFLVIAVAAGDALRSVFGMIQLGFGTLLFAALGAVVASDEDLRRLDGED